MKKFRYRANLHCHTTVSDGSQTPEQIRDIYKAKGYHIVAFTDHETLKGQTHLCDKDFLAVNSVEMALSQPGDMPWPRKKCYHLNLYAMRQDMTQTPVHLHEAAAYDDIAAINKYITERTAEGFLVCYNHPYWSLQTFADYGNLQGCFAMEIYNHGCEVTDGYYGYHPQAYDEMLRQSHGRGLFCVSTDDNHNRGPAGNPHIDSFGGWIWVDSPSLDYGDVMQAIARGDFYSSQGPEIYDYGVKDNLLTVQCDPCELITVYTQGRHCQIKTGTDMEHAEFTLKGDEGYVRVMCRNKYKKDANTNAIWLG